jgi:hypothetical protein
MSPRWGWTTVSDLFKHHGEQLQALGLLATGITKLKGILLHIDGLQTTLLFFD